jgi:hypothetical protein
LDHAKTIAPNWTKASIAKTLCEICPLLVYYTPQSGNSLPTFRDNLLAPFSKIKKIKKENTAGLKLTDKMCGFFCGGCTFSFV